MTDKIDRFFPSIKNTEKITVSHLLSHRSGIPNFTDQEDYPQWNTQRKTEQELPAIMAKGGSDFEPGSKAQYSNSNFVLLSFILQKIYHQEFAQILNDKIIRVIGLKNTDFGKKINTKDRACSYRFKEHWEKEAETDLSIPPGAGAIAASPADLVKFANTLFNGGLISTKDPELMKTIKDNFGMGLFQIPFYDKTGYGHSGEIDGFHSVFSFFPGDKVCFALFSNGLNCVLNDISIAVLSAVYNKEYEIPTFKSSEMTSEELDKYTGVYASSQLPMKITVTKNNKTLIAQATGQPSFPLEATGKDKFKFDQALLVMEFNPAEKTMILKQGGGVFNFAKE